MRNRVLVEKTPDQFIAASLIAIHTWHRPLKLITTLAVVFPFNFLHSLLSSSSLLPWYTDKTDFCESRYRKYHISSHFLFLFSFVHFDFSFIPSISEFLCTSSSSPLRKLCAAYWIIHSTERKIPSFPFLSTKKNPRFDSSANPTNSAEFDGRKEGFPNLSIDLSSPFLGLTSIVFYIAIFFPSTRERYTAGSSIT